MSSRITRHNMFMDICDVLAKRSTCCRQNVGALLTHRHRIVSTGWNGAPSGEPHCLGKDCPLTSAGGCSRSIHAEVNALTFAPRDLKDLTLYVSLSPCIACATEIVNSYRVSRVFYRQEYRLKTGLEELWFYNISTYRITPAGYVLDTKTNQLVEER